MKYKKTIIIVTHDLNEARSLGESVHIYKQSEVIKRGQYKHYSAYI